MWRMTLFMWFRSRTSKLQSVPMAGTVRVWVMALQPLKEREACQEVAGVEVAGVEVVVSEVVVAVDCSAVLFWAVPPERYWAAALAAALAAAAFRPVPLWCNRSARLQCFCLRTCSA